MTDHTTRLQTVVKGALTENALVGETYGYNVVQGLCVQPSGTGAGTQLVLGWTLTVSMRHPLIGYPDIAMAAPLPGVLPPDDMFRQLSKALIQAVREKRDEEMKVSRVVKAA